MKGSRIFILILTFCFIIVGCSTVYRAAWDSIQRTDYSVYIAAGQAVIDHTDIYKAQNVRGWRYVYPPPFAILMVPLAHLPAAIGSFIWFLLEVGAIAASSFMSVALLKDIDFSHKKYLLYALPLLSLCVLLISGVLRCQASAFMFCLIIAAFYFNLNNKPVYAGLSLAAAILIKVFPATLIVYFLIRKKWSMLAATFVGLILFSLVLPSLVWGWQQNIDNILRWIDVVGHPTLESNAVRAHISSIYGQLLDTTKPRNQSLESLFLTINTPSYLVNYFVAASGLFMLVVMWFAATKIKNHFDELMLCSTFIVWALLITPISETHYFGALILPITVLLGHALHRDYDPKTQRLLIVFGTCMMLLVMIFIGIDEIALLRPLTIISLIIWALLLGLIFKTSIQVSAVRDNSLQPA
jgi:hypothetical protein